MLLSNNGQAYSLFLNVLNARNSFGGGGVFALIDSEVCKDGKDT